ncbi:NAD(P)/FAD-dependent oxidoreductase [Pontixanthobacter aquaemixtae]|uniref:FAD-dependent oxidoreductase n=1 Tax=Pontixanthobacter aquaemixtae TaxID=1958940 RepID=A0A844ZR56_9SPHN|nr:FAD-dependent oxidoreductase [Pontixanthobacter aquaemixtae]MXO89496.1 FAD-dependent oxidoreductase [Pontixanthobacter aquaemixtae]
MNDTRFDFAIVGAGMAGASLAAELAPHASVLLLEAEDQPGYHATGRSAAFWDECYGGPDVVPLTLASGGFLREHGLLSPRGALHLARTQDRAKVDAFLDTFGPTGASIERLDRDQIDAKLGGLRDHWVEAIWEPACADIDVGGLHALYLSKAKAAGVELAVRARVEQAKSSAKGWHIRTADGREFRADKLVNAAGAWADPVTEMAGCRPLGITPYRRTVAQLRTTPAPASDQPLVLDISGRFYFKPESGRIWLSPHDEEASPPCDAAPEELAVATAIDRLQDVVTWQVDRVETKWAGLRSFAPDRLPVYGPDPSNSDFFWFAGQGGFGIQTAPAAAQITACQLLGHSVPDHLAGINVKKYAATRFA